MSWEIVLQSTIAILISIVGWFLFEMISEFKDFKREAKTDIKSLQRERATFEATVKHSELFFGMRVTDLQRLHNDFDLQTKKHLTDLELGVDKVVLKVDLIASKAQSIEEVTTKIVTVLKHHAHDIKELKIKMGEVTVFKTSK